MKIAVSSVCWWSDTLPDICRKAAAAGFTALEPLMFPKEIFPLHGDLRDISPAQLTRLLGDHGLTLAALHIAALWTDTPERARALTDYLLRTIDAAEETGCNLVVVGGPERHARHPFRPFLEALEKVAPRLDGRQVVIGLENHYRNWIETPADYDHIFDYVPHPRIGMTLDTGHFASAGADPVKVAETYFDKVVHVHIKDHKGHDSMPLGRGDVDIPAVVRALKARGYNGWLTQEIEVAGRFDVDQSAAEGYPYMRTLLQL